MSEIVLFGVPYAGGSAAAIYGKWAKYLGPTIRVVPLEMAGHGRRMAEPFHNSLLDAVTEMLKIVAPIARTQSYAFYGHSMGCVLVYELIKAIAQAGLPAPKAVFLSGRNPPHHVYAGKDIHYLADDVFLQEIKKIGGTPKEFFEMPDLMKVFTPVLRADYRLIERYRFSEPRYVMPADLFFFSSDQDHLVTSPHMEGWAEYTSKTFTLKHFSGDHFFINHLFPEICAIVQKNLLQWVEQEAV